MYKNPLMKIEFKSNMTMNMNSGLIESENWNGNII